MDVDLKTNTYDGDTPPTVRQVDTKCRAYRRDEPGYAALRHSSASYQMGKAVRKY